MWYGSDTSIFMVFEDTKRHMLQVLSTSSSTSWNNGAVGADVSGNL